MTDNYERSTCTGCRTSWRVIKEADYHRCIDDPSFQWMVRLRKFDPLLAQRDVMEASFKEAVASTSDSDLAMAARSILVAAPEDQAISTGKPGWRPANWGTLLSFTYSTEASKAAVEHVLDVEDDAEGDLRKARGALRRIERQIATYEETVAEREAAQEGDSKRVGAMESESPATTLERLVADRPGLEAKARSAQNTHSAKRDKLVQVVSRVLPTTVARIRCTRCRVPFEMAGSDVAASIASGVAPPTSRCLCWARGLNVVYALRDDAGRLLYVGKSQSVARRMVEHSNSQPWWSEVATATARPVHGAGDVLSRAEAEAIRVMCPDWNEVRYGA